MRSQLLAAGALALLTIVGTGAAASAQDAREYRALVNPYCNAYHCNRVKARKFHYLTERNHVRHARYFHRLHQIHQEHLAMRRHRHHDGY